MGTNAQISKVPADCPCGHALGSHKTTGCRCKNCKCTGNRERVKVMMLLAGKPVQPLDMTADMIFLGGEKAERRRKQWDDYEEDMNRWYQTNRRV